MMIKIDPIHKDKDYQHVILGCCMKTADMIEVLEDADIEKIAVVDYFFEDHILEFGKYNFYSPQIANKLFGKSDKVVFHKYLTRR